MSQHEINHRIERLISIVIGLAFLAALLIYVQRKDAADERQIRAQVAKQAKQDAQPDTWAKLDQDARRMTSYDRIGK